MPVSKQGLEGRGNMAHHGDWQQEALHPLSIAPTNPQRESCQGIEDYELKVSITAQVRRGP
jgi:hypothetical protein